MPYFPDVHPFSIRMWNINKKKKSRAFHVGKSSNTTKRKINQQQYRITSQTLGGNTFNDEAIYNFLISHSMKPTFCKPVWQSDAYWLPLLAESTEVISLARLWPSLLCAPKELEKLGAVCTINTVQQAGSTLWNWWWCPWTFCSLITVQLTQTTSLA